MTATVTRPASRAANPIPAVPISRAAELHDRFIALCRHLTALAIATAPTADTPEAATAGVTYRSARAAEQDVNATIARMERMADQASREWARDDLTAMQSTINVISAIVQGEFILRLRAWADAELDDPALRRDLRAWADDIDNLELSNA
jgi:hypothetical protein